MSLPTQPITFRYFADGSINEQNPEFDNYTQLEKDANIELQTRLLQKIDSAKWDAISLEIASLVEAADSVNDPGIKSLIYGKIMIIITAQYLPVISDFLGNQIAQQASIQNLAADISAFLADGQNAANALAASGSDLDTANQDKLFDGVMGLIGAVSGATNPDLYSYNFEVIYESTSIDANGNIILSTETIQVSSVLDFLTNPDIWGETPPISLDGADQIQTALSTIPIIYNEFPTDPAAPVDPETDLPVPSNSWQNELLEEIADATYTWTQPFGASSHLSNSQGGIATEDAPLVYTEPSSVQQEFNQSTQAVQTVATSTQTTQNFLVQEINQYYGITNSIQQSQQQLGASMVRKQIV